MECHTCSLAERSSVGICRHEEHSIGDSRAQILLHDWPQEKERRTSMPICLWYPVTLTKVYLELIIPTVGTCSGVWISPASNHIITFRCGSKGACLCRWVVNDRSRAQLRLEKVKEAAVAVYQEEDGSLGSRIFFSRYLNGEWRLKSHTNVLLRLGNDWPPGVWCRGTSHVTPATPAYKHIHNHTHTPIHTHITGEKKLKLLLNTTVNHISLRDCKYRERYDLQFFLHCRWFFFQLFFLSFFWGVAAFPTPFNKNFWILNNITN